MTTRLAIAFLVGIPVLWTCWLAYKLAEYAVRVWYWIKGANQRRREMMDCQLLDSPGKGRCCCNCTHQMLAMKHPWNNGKAKGSITEIFGALCALPDMGVSPGGRRQAVFFDTGHGMCEMHEHLPDNAEITAPKAAG